ncbi:MAG: hypothetical protein ACLQIB_57100 [Isosphaeraceae bacterium]
MRRALSTLLFLGLAAGVCPVQAGDDPGKNERPGATGQHRPKQAYLGMEIEELSPALSSQLAGVVPPGQGVLVTRVPGDSPAAKAGLQSYDIMLS